jgi:hypothetical protein
MGSSTIWAPVVAALGASILTTGGLLVRDWLVGKRRRGAERLAAYEELIAQGTLVLQTAAALRLTMKIRSGLIEGWDIALRHRRPLEPLELADRLLRDFQPLLAAWTRVWSIGSVESIPLADELVERCIRLIDVATEKGRGGTALRRYLSGERWTPQQEDALAQAHKDVGDARRRLAELRRSEGGEPAAEFWGPLQEE